MSVPIFQAYEKVERIIATSEYQHLKICDDLVMRFFNMYYDPTRINLVSYFCDKLVDAILQRRCYLLIQQYSFSE